ncbi:hypothetical protein CTEN210_04116 [Chaetoceros tenuissimus]|uniref:F-box domain-containing protein n=1 Tax=Chaetoceros tenuissimus TaxID=426638 RepID=A0AAD3H291_9STRA|nr:hypothetical protein CTEN210_04116 [Chaetoceros tenuissimus]
MSANKRLKVSHGNLREELPSASISDLPNDLLKHCFSFIPGQYVTVAPVSRQFHRNYCTVGIDDSLTALTTDTLLKVGKNRRTTAESVSDDIKLTEYCFINNAPKKFMMKVCREAALKGRIDMIECADIFGVDLIKLGKEGALHDRLIDKFAKNGNLEMIQYFDRIKLLEDFDIYDWRIVFDFAAKSDHLHIMKWIFDKKRHLIFEDSDDETYYRSTIEAYEHIIEGVKTNKVTFKLCELAARKGDIEALEHCHQRNHPFEIHQLLYDCSMRNKDKEQALETLKWLRRRGCPWNESLCSSAAWNGNLEALKWARSEGCPWSDATLTAAADRGNIAIMEYCLQNQCPMTVEACCFTMRNKNQNTAFECLKLLREYSCPWDESTCTRAGFKGHFEVMRWAKCNGCPWSETEFRIVVHRGNPYVIKEFLQDEPRQNTDSLFKAALSNGSSTSSQIIEKLKLLREYGYRWTANTTLEAAKQGRLQVLQWLRYVGCAFNVDSCIAVVKSENIDILKYLQRIAG